MVTKKTQLLAHNEMEGGGNFSLVSFVKCFNGCKDQAQVSSFGTRIWNFSDKSIELQIRVGSILKKVHTLKPGSSKRLNSKKIYKAYMPELSQIKVLDLENQGAVAQIKERRKQK
ncbi:hypothetical protein K7X08_008460 [Anisodus acutangulus]|uniref:Uncharacterized protein n=1 Tax=Anisodus acutangulus TaxID=402998 RepID=A0A9Q1MW86_9SOLA|nr:hypothetical protein K7X08_008460 [Anisodus acutangulus]